MVYRNRRLQGILWSPAMHREKCGTKEIHAALSIDRQYNAHYTIVITIVSGMMVGQKYYLYLGKDRKKFFSLPETWTISHFVEGKSIDRYPRRA
jgi:hypothetical protein